MVKYSHFKEMLMILLARMVTQLLENSRIYDYEVKTPQKKLMSGLVIVCFCRRISHWHGTIPFQFGPDLTHDPCRHKMVNGVKVLNRMDF